jgi:hypothetical protein
MTVVAMRSEMGADWPATRVAPPARIKRERIKVAANLKIAPSVVQVETMWILPICAIPVKKLSNRVIGLTFICPKETFLSTIGGNQGRMRLHFNKAPVLILPEALHLVPVVKKISHREKWYDRFE